MGLPVKISVIYIQNDFKNFFKLEITDLLAHRADNGEIEGQLPPRSQRF